MFSIKMEAFFHICAHSDIQSDKNKGSSLLCAAGLFSIYIPNHLCPNDILPWKNHSYKKGGVFLQTVFQADYPELDIFFEQEKLLEQIPAHSFVTDIPHTDQESFLFSYLIYTGFSFRSDGIWPFYYILALLQVLPFHNKYNILFVRLFLHHKKCNFYLHQLSQSIFSSHLEEPARVPFFY